MKEKKKRFNKKKVTAAEINIARQEIQEDRDREWIRQNAKRNVEAIDRLAAENGLL